MEKDKSYGLKAWNIKANFLMDKNMGKDNIIFQIIVSMMEI
jgi:hypothetical protein